MSTPRWKIVRHPDDGHIVHIEYIGHGMFTWAGEIQNIANLAEADAIAARNEQVIEALVEEHDRAGRMDAGERNWIVTASINEVARRVGLADQFAARLRDRAEGKP